IQRKVPANSFYWVFKMPERLSPEYYIVDLLSDVLSRGKSSRLFNRLVKQKPLLSEVNAYIMGSFDEGMLVITGNLNDGISFDEVGVELEAIIKELVAEGISKEELVKVKNKLETTKLF